MPMLMMLCSSFSNSNTRGVTYLKQNKSNNQQNPGSSSQGKGNTAKNAAGKNIKKTGRIYYTQVAITPEGEPIMMGLNNRLQRKMATCLDLSYSRAVCTALAVEAKYAGPGKSKGYGGDRSNQGPEKRQRLVI